MSAFHPFLPFSELLSVESANDPIADIGDFSRIGRVNDIQSATCERFGTAVVPSEPHLKLGLALATLNENPINGLRHNPEGDATGWYVWGGGELSSEDDFFQPICIAHLDEMVPWIIPYLALPPGWRFQIAEGHEDVWFDGALLT